MIIKLDENTARFVEPEKIIPETIIEDITYEEQKAKWLQAKESVEAQREEFEAIIAPQQATVDLFYAQLMEMEAQGIKEKPVEVIKEEIIETPIEEKPIETPIEPMPVEEIIK